MKRVLKMQDLDCANCAAKMENATGGDECRPELIWPVNL